LRSADQFSVQCVRRTIFSRVRRIIEIPKPGQVWFLSGKLLEHVTTDLLGRARALPETDFVHLAVKVREGLSENTGAKQVSTAARNVAEAAGKRMSRG
jgi:hypothetical protein